MALVVVLWAFPVSASAQSFWLHPQGDDGISLDVLKPGFKVDRIAWPTSSFFLSGRFSFSGRKRLVVDIPVSHFSFNRSEPRCFGRVCAPVGQPETKTILGNPYVGMTFEATSARLVGEVGLRVPVLAEEDVATTTGVYSDFQRYEAFAEQQGAFVGALSYQRRVSSDVSLRFRLAPSLLWARTDAVSSSDRHALHTAYSVQGWYATGPVRMGGGLAGRVAITREDRISEERALHELGLAVVGTFGIIQLGLHLRWLLDDYRGDYTDYVLGLSVTALLK